MLKKTLDNLIHFKKAPESSDFGELEVKLMKVKPKARASFRQDLREKLKARHQEMMEREIEKEAGFFHVHRFAASMALACILVVFGGGLAVSAAGTPMAQNRPLANINPEWHPSIAPITIEFDKSMMESSVEDAFSIYPAVEGNFVWENRQTMHFLPNEPLNPNQQYVVTISQDAKSLFQKPIKTAFEQKINVFETELNQEITDKLKTLKELQRSTMNLSAEEKEAVIEQIKELEAELEDFFKQQKNTTQQNPINTTTQSVKTEQERPPRKVGSESA